MRRDIGKMRQRVVVYEPVRTADGGLGFIRSNKPIVSLWANVKDASGSELYAYQHLEQRITHSVTVRYDARIRQGMFLAYGERNLYIESVVDLNERREFQKLICREGGNL